MLNPFLLALLSSSWYTSGCNASLWSEKQTRPIDVHKQGPAENRETANRGVDIDGISVVLRNYESLDKYTRRSDCFLRAAGEIRSRCGDLELHEYERVDAAISMTLCELSTAAHFSPPMECAAYTNQKSTWNPETDSTRNNCVEAFSRSTQFWSSYSGYLREVPQLCFAFRRWNDIDTAREIYHNVTLESTTLLRHLNAREAGFETAILEFQNHLGNLQAATSRLDAATDDMSAVPKNLRFWFDQSREEILLLLGRQIDSLVEAQKERALTVWDRAEEALQLSTQKHSNELEAVLLSIRTGLEEVVVATTNVLQSRIDRLATDLDSFKDSVSLHSDGINTLTKLVYQSSSSANEVAKTVDIAIQGSRILSENQDALSSRLAVLGSTVRELSETAQEEQEKFANMSAIVFERTLQGHYRRPFFPTILEWVIPLLLKDTSSMEFLWNHTAFRVGASLISWLVRSAISSLPPVVFFLLSFRSWFVRAAPGVSR